MIDIIDDFPLLPVDCVLSRVFFSLDVVSFGRGTSLDHDHSFEHTCNVFPLQPRKQRALQNAESKWNWNVNIAGCLNEKEIGGGMIIKQIEQTVQVHRSLSWPQPFRSCNEQLFMTFYRYSRDTSFRFMFFIPPRSCVPGQSTNISRTTHRKLLLRCGMRYGE